MLSEFFSLCASFVRKDMFTKIYWAIVIHAMTTLLDDHAYALTFHTVT
jgi:hypothetical protein